MHGGRPALAISGELGKRIRLPSAHVAALHGFPSLSARNTVRTGWRRIVESDIVEPRVHCRSLGLHGFRAPREAGEASVSTFTFFVMLNAMVFVYHHSRSWWRENVWRRAARRRSSLKAQSPLGTPGS